MENIRALKDPFPHLIVENMYDEEELSLIWEELEFLNKPEKLQDPEIYSASKTKNEFDTNSKAIILDRVYTNRNISNILRINRKLFNYCKIYSDLSPYYIKFAYCNTDLTKIRYYQDKEFYLPHCDDNFDTLACTYFYKEPKKFDGGKLFFPEYNYSVECKNNSCIIFPSYFMHGVSEVRISDKNYNSGFGRYCMTQFTNVRHNIND